MMADNKPDNKALCPIRLMLVEDNRGDVLLFKRAMQRAEIPHELIVAPTGEKALRLVREAADGEQVDMIILDLNLPGLNGHQVLAVLKAHEDYRRIPVFILSSSEAPEDVVAGYNEYANCYIVKPHDLEKLNEIVQCISNFWYSLAAPSQKTGRREWEAFL